MLVNRAVKPLAIALSAAICMTSAVPAHADTPVSVTVFTLAPGVFEYPPGWFQNGVGLFESPNQRVRIPYPNFPSDAHLDTGVANLDQYLHDFMGNTANNGHRAVVVGHSFGAEVQDAWLREKGPTSDIDPNRVEFILTGDPEAKYNGCMNIPATVTESPPCEFRYDGGGTKGFPDGTRYSVTVVARQYDFWADAPDKTSSANYQLALENRKDANSVGGQGELSSVHTNYAVVYRAMKLNAASRVEFTMPNTVKTEATGDIKYVVGPATYYLPSVTKQWKSAEQKAALDTEQRPKVEDAYTRTAPAPPA